MPLSIVGPELFGVTGTSCTLTFAVHDASGPADAPAEVLLDGVPHATSEGVAETRLVRVEGSRRAGATSSTSSRRTVAGPRPTRSSPAR